MKNGEWFHSASRIHVARLQPGDDLRQKLLDIAAAKKMKAAVIVTCVGSLVQYNLRFANRKGGSMRRGHFEIVSLTGSLSASSLHLHLSVSDGDGSTTGGHLLDGNLIYTTAEIAIVELTGLVFQRVLDPATGYDELRIGKPGKRGKPL
jgi:predicted DNA-binding protein with PD1-like motif